MLILAIDDELRMRHMLQTAIEEAAPEAEVRVFPDGEQALEAIEKQGLRPKFIFSDIQMPGLDGLQLAVRLRTVAPDARLIFVTAYQEYALDAFRLHASGYIVKPVEAARIREELAHHAPRADTEEEKRKLHVRCFGPFEVFLNGAPLIFGRQQTKELFAYLIDRRGALCSAEEIVAAIWEDEGDLKLLKHRLRNLVSDLRRTLEEVGFAGLLLRRRNQIAILPEQIDCDYYRMLAGEMDAINAFRGEYMAQYSWAELTKGELVFRSGTV